MRRSLPIAPPKRNHLLALFVLLLGLAGASVGHAADPTKKQPYLIYPGDPTRWRCSGS